MTSSHGLSLDHLVITTLFDLRRARDLFSRLGFTLSARGEHAMGSENHLILFEDSFLELIGVPREGPVQRKEVLDALKGIDGLVYKTGDADRLHATLAALGLPLQPLHAFGRLVERDGKTLEAKFRTVRALPGTFEAGRVYYCQHLTPELVWFPEQQTHRNGICSLDGLTLVADDPRAAADRMALWVGVPPVAVEDGFRLVTGAFRLDITSSATYRETHGELCCDTLGRHSYFGAIHLRTHDLDALDALLVKERNGNSAFVHQRSASSISIRIPEFNTLLVVEALGHEADA